MKPFRQTKLYQGVRHFFFPPPGSTRFRRALPYLVVIGVVALGAVFAVATWEITNSNGFCGTVCHDIMYPYAASYEHSAHSRVDCVECHMGRTPLTDQLPRKFVHARELYAMITNSYEQPLVATTLRPSRVTCELCHYPPQFFMDSVMEVRRYENNRENTAVSTWLILKTGGGLQREGLGYGIHWHVENQIYYYATDDRRQTIPWMRVVDAEGNVTEYMDVDFRPAEGFPAEGDLRLMDCIDCHNRTGHSMLSPEQAVDSALQRGLIAANVPYIRQEAVAVMSGEYATTEEALAAIDGLDARYAETYAPIYGVYREEIQQAVEVLRAVYQENFFPELGVNWQTQPNNIGHSDWPGCFRCHDGRHVSAEGSVVRVECNLCHSIPSVVRGGGGAEISLTRGPEPASHLDSAWLHRHYAVDETCALCHDVSNPGGADDSSFCSNSACHGTEWQFADLSAPALAGVLGLQPPVPLPTATPTGEESPTYAGTIGPLLTSRCGTCHGAAAGLDVTSYATLMTGGTSGPVVVPGDAEGSRLVQTVRGQHFARLESRELDLLIAWINSGAPEGTPTSGAPAPATPAAPTGAEAPPTRASRIPHPLEGRADCLLCHGASASRPYPANHTAFPVTACLVCHSTEREGKPPTAIEHPLEGRADCLACHPLTGLPSTHQTAQFTSADCLLCHTVRGDD